MIELAEAESSARLARVLGLVRAKFAGAAAALERFATALFAKHGSEYLAELGDEEAVALVVGAHRFLLEQDPPPRVRAFAPTFAVDGWESTSAVVQTAMPDRPFIVDTIREYFRSENVEVRHLLHPILSADVVDGDGQTG